MSNLHNNDIPDDIVLENTTTTTTSTLPSKSLPLSSPSPSQIPHDFFVKLPKAELHAHLNGSIPLSTVVELVKDHVSQNPDSELEKYTTDEYINGNGFLVTLPSAEISAGESLELKQMILHKCFDIFKIIHSIVTSKSALIRITTDVIKSFHSDGVTYLELRTTPKAMKDTDIPTCSDYISTVLDATTEALKNCPGMTVRYLLSINREKHSISDAQEIVNLAIQYKKHTADTIPGGFIVGIDVSGNPTTDGNISRFGTVLNSAIEAGLCLSVHFAEIYDPIEAHWILTKLKPERIGHGNFLDDNLKKLMTNSPIPLEICCTSNILTASVRSPKLHHFSEFYTSEYPVVICTDDKGVFNTTLSNEYHLLCNGLLSPLEITKLAKDSFKYAFAYHPNQTKILTPPQIALWKEWKNSTYNINSTTTRTSTIRKGEQE